MSTCDFSGPPQCKFLIFFCYTEESQRSHNLSRLVGRGPQSKFLEGYQAGFLEQIDIVYHALKVGFTFIHLGIKQFLDIKSAVFAIA